MQIFENSLYSAKEFAGALSVNAGSIYQSLPGAACRAKLGRSVPNPIRLGRALRWSGRQIIDFVASLEQELKTNPKPPGIKLVALAENHPKNLKRRPGRPKKSEILARGAE